MKKTRIKFEINGHIIEGIGTKDNNILKLETKEEKLEFNQEELYLLKTNKDLAIKLDFKNKKVFYRLVEAKQEFINNLLIFSLTNTDKQVIINYRIEQTDFTLKINYETM